MTRLSSAEQDYWLRRAEQQKWSRNELRRALRAGLAAQSDAAENPTGGADERQEAPRQQVTTLTIELSADQLEQYSQAAAAHGLPVDKWVARMVTQVLDTADRRVADKRLA
ncbi:hypothetical protein ACQ4WX_01580 [Streptomyces lasalocidi]